MYDGGPIAQPPIHHAHAGDHDDVEAVLGLDDLGALVQEVDVANVEMEVFSLVPRRATGILGARVLAAP